MNIAIDIRCLIEKHRTGVGEYTYELLNALFEFDTTNQYFLFYNSWKDVSDSVPVWKKNNVHYVVTRWPNKILNLLLWLNLIKLDRFIKRKLKNKDVRCKIKRLKDLDSTTMKEYNPTNEDGIPQRRDNETVNQLDYFFSPNVNFISLSNHVKSILTIHDLSFIYFKHCFTVKQRLWHWFIRPRVQCRRANIILTPSENTRRDVVKCFGVEEHKIQVVKPRLNIIFGDQCHAVSDQVRLKYKLPEKFILYLGTIEPRKNILSIIEAYKKSSLYTGHCSLVIAGAKGWKYKKILKAVKNTPGVHYIGYVDAQDKPALYRLSSLFVYPSLYEGYGLPVAEAMACGANVVTSNRSSLPEVSAGRAFLVNPCNIYELSKVLAQCCTK